MKIWLRNRQSKIHLAAMLGALIALSTPLSALELQSHESIRQAARQYVLDTNQSQTYPMRVEAGRLDSRLRLEACDKPLETFSTPGAQRASKVTVGVRCTGTKPWSLYVPTSISIMAPIVVAKHNLPRGSLLTKESLILEVQDIARLHRGYMEDIGQAVGKILKRNLSRGQALNPRHIETPMDIKRGSRVTIIAGNGGISVRMQGKALSNGAKGELIRVRNLSSKRELEAMVVSPGIVRVVM